MAVLHTINVLLAELCEKVTQLIDASSNTTINTAPGRPLCIPSNPAVFHSPQPHPMMTPTARTLPLLLSPWPLQTLAPHIPQLPVNNLTNYQISIPTTPPITCAYIAKAAMNQGSLAPTLATLASPGSHLPAPVWVFLACISLREITL